MANGVSTETSVHVTTAGTSFKGPHCGVSQRVTSKWYFSRPKPIRVEGRIDRLLDQNTFARRSDGKVYRWGFEVNGPRLPLRWILCGKGDLYL